MLDSIARAQQQAVLPGCQSVSLFEICPCQIKHQNQPRKQVRAANAMGCALSAVHTPCTPCTCMCVRYLARYPLSCIASTCLSLASPKSTSHSQLQLLFSFLGHKPPTNQPNLTNPANSQEGQNTARQSAWQKKRKVGHHVCRAYTKQPDGCKGQSSLMATCQQCRVCVSVCVINNSQMFARRYILHIYAAQPATNT